MKLTKTHQTLIITYIMNLLDKKLWPVLSLAAILFSCEDPGQIGLDTDPTNGKFSSKYVEINLPTNMVQLGTSFDSKNTGRLLVGEFSDVDLGSVVAKTYFQLEVDNPQDSLVALENGFDSLVLRLKYDYAFGEVQLSHLVKVSTLQDTISDELEYSNQSTFQLKDEVANQSIGFLFDEDATTVRFDTTVSIVLDFALGESIFLEAKKVDGALVDQESFEDFMPGLAIEALGASAVFGFDPFNAESKMYMYYHVNDTTLDSLSFSLTGNHVNQLITDMSATEFATIVPNQDFLTNDQYHYLHGTNQIGLEINLSPFYDYFDTIPQIVLNKGELALESLVDKGDYQNPPSPLYFYHFLESNKLETDSVIVDAVNLDRFGNVIDSTFVGYRTIQINDQTLLNQPLPAEYSDDKSEIKAIATSYLQDITDELEEANQLLIFPNIFDARRSVNGLKIPKDGVKLRIYYSIPNSN